MRVTLAFVLTAISVASSAVIPGADDFLQELTGQGPASAQLNAEGKVIRGHCNQNSDCASNYCQVAPIDSKYNFCVPGTGLSEPSSQPVEQPQPVARPNDGKKGHGQPCQQPGECSSNYCMVGFMPGEGHCVGNGRSKRQADDGGDEVATAVWNEVQDECDPNNDQCPANSSCGTYFGGAATGWHCIRDGIISRRTVPLPTNTEEDAAPILTFASQDSSSKLGTFAPCSAAEQCASGYCNTGVVGTTGFCDGASGPLPPKPAPRLAVAKSSDGKLGAYARCSSPDQCSSGYCNTGFVGTEGFCD